jgi:hypothetical protein
MIRLYNSQCSTSARNLCSLAVSWDFRQWLATLVDDPP